MQDFTKRMGIVVREDLPGWQVTNTVAHIAAYLGNKMKEPFDTGESFFTEDGVAHPRNTQYPIIVFRAAEKDLPALMQEVRSSGLSYLGFIREMIETTDDSEIEKILGNKKDEAVEYLGIGLFGPDDILKAITKKFSLWK
jgi:hypothetical protein